ncbi:helix-turn-helix domain-containing protein [Streptomyces sp. NPDC056956]|jgi:excisionase family DNA binding protein|uniref:helix-turn-helix domain-containing protein n=1 Tax=Streptomyces TaxID=1883 RepID=UPI00363A2814
MSRTDSVHGTGDERGSRYLGVDEAAAYLNLSRRWMYRESQRHGLPRYYFGGKLRFKVADLDVWAQQQKVS